MELRFLLQDLLLMQEQTPIETVKFAFDNQKQKPSLKMWPGSLTKAAGHPLFCFIKNNQTLEITYLLHLNHQYENNIDPRVLVEGDWTLRFISY